MSVRNLAVSLLSAGAMLPAPAARGQTLTTLYEFIGGRTGGNPASGVILLGRVLYGTTPVGGERERRYCIQGQRNDGRAQSNLQFCGRCRWPESRLGADLPKRRSLRHDVGWGSAGAGTVFSVDSATKTETVVHSLAERMGVARVN